MSSNGIVRTDGTDVNSDSDEIFDPFEDLIAEMHAFLDDLVESGEREDRDLSDAFLGGNYHE